MSTTFSGERLVTAREAVELSGVSMNTVKKAISQRIISPERRRHRLLLDPEVIGGLELLNRTSVALPVEQKKMVVGWAMRLPKAGEELKLDDVLFVKADEAFVELMGSIRRYVELRNDLIEVDPEIAGGEPVIKGSRVPVRSLAHQIALGESREVLREDYPHLPDEAFEIAPLWAKANPRTGRPRKP
jgi:uncharacterized protein (DUF433 family)